MHLQDEQIQRLLHDELDHAVEVSVRAHLVDCGTCRSRLQGAEREERQVFEHLRRLDHSPPRVGVADLTARARRPRADYRWAAGIVLALSAAGLAYAVPGSPVPGLLERVGEWIGVSERPVPSGATPEEWERAGIAIAPGERFTLLLDSPNGNVVATVILTGGSDIVVRSEDGAVSFTTGIEHLTITTGSAITRLVIELPRRAPRIEIRSMAETLLLKDGERIVTSATMDGEGRWILALNNL